MKDKGEEFESCESIKARALSPMKDKGEDFESYETSQ